MTIWNGGIWGSDSNGDGTPSYGGSETFNGETGVSITIGETLDGTDYQVAIMPTADALNVGAIYITDKTTTTFKVKCTGGGTPTFDWTLRDNN